MRILACHLLNDFSGSPKVLRQLLKGWAKNGLEVHLYTCGGREGFLSDLEGVVNHTYWYRFAKNRVVRLFFLLISQFLLAIKILFEAKKGDIIYINTVLPFGAALAGKIRRIRIIYHIHETTMKPLILKTVLFGIAKHTADKAIYVSGHLSNEDLLPNVKSHVLYNAIEEEWYQKRLEKIPHTHKNVLMVCSLKSYKGVNEFVKLAEISESYSFTLVVNATNRDINQFFKGYVLPENFRIFPTQTNLHPFYAAADVILNLSIPEFWVETFGLTIIEGMAYGLPAIVPTIGGIAELVKDGANGYGVDSKDLPGLKRTLDLILKSPEFYLKLSNQAAESLERFREDSFIKESIQILRNSN